MLESSKWYVRALRQDRGAHLSSDAVGRGRWLRVAVPLAVLFGVVGWLVGTVVGALLATSDFHQRAVPGISGLVRYLLAFIGAAGGLALASAEEATQSIARRIYGGSFDPVKPDYAVADGAALRGAFDAALAGYEEGAAEHAWDPEPLLRGARLLAGMPGRHDQALAWFKRARARAEALGRANPREAARARSLDVQITREIIELHTLERRDPEAALPELARLAERAAATPSGDWARQRLNELRQDLHGSRTGQAGDDGPG